MKIPVKKISPRHAAILCLAKWSADRRPIQPLIDLFVHRASLIATDRHLAVQLVLGVLRQLQYLDSVISQYAKHPLAKMKPLTLMALRVGVYQILFLDRIPDSAAVNETVKALKAEKQPHWLANFVNGVLRTISRRKNEIQRPDQEGPQGSIILNHPQWLVHRWQERYGQDLTAQICLSNNQEPRLTLRANTKVTIPESLIQLFADAGIAARIGKFAPGALLIDDPAGPVSSLPGYDQGYFHVQDEAAQLVNELVGPFRAGERYLDACAGLGGKTLTLAQLLPEDAELVCVEPNDNRFHLLQENIKRMGFATKVASFQGRLGDQFKRDHTTFQGILVDAPCSGTGVVGRHPDIRWNRTENDLAGYQQQQLDILTQSIQLLKPGGILVYATCSMETEENDQVVDMFMADNPDFIITDAGLLLPASVRRLVNNKGYFVSTPADGLDGFFAARLERKS